MPSHNPHYFCVSLWVNPIALLFNSYKVLTFSKGGLANFVPWVLAFDSKLVATVQWIKEGLRETHKEYERVTLEQIGKSEESFGPVNMTKDYLERSTGTASHMT